MANRLILLGAGKRGGPGQGNGNSAVVFSSGGGGATRFVFDETASGPPAGYITSRGAGKFQIDTAATSGLTVSVIGGRPTVIA
jgi:hypothetical protein